MDSQEGKYLWFLVDFWEAENCEKSSAKNRSSISYLMHLYTRFIKEQDIWTWTWILPPKETWTKKRKSVKLTELNDASQKIHQITKVCAFNLLLFFMLCVAFCSMFHKIQVSQY